ncbi:MAG: ShlB/FhaC/HecB family hemolysin secretion/activation protein [Chlorogloea purpurea SAG 13.99]|nr:ShlB/FhaC/HecB family hemolysin secretion/activation protein [Chlorogloea purpurea SAG 13.99]
MSDRTTCSSKPCKILLSLNLLLIQGGLFFALCDRVLAQINAPRTPIRFPLPPQQPTPIPVPQPLPSNDFRFPLPTIPAPEERSNILGTITVAKFQFIGNTAFSDKDLTAVTAPFIDRPLTFVELLQVEAAITKLYTDAGYINSGAVIPAGQTLSKENAVIKVQIIEGSIEDIRVSVDGRLNPDYVRSRLALATGKPFNQNRLLQALQLLQLDPVVGTISANLSAGSRPQSSILSVKVKEADTLTGEIFLDNGRVESIGSFERGLRITTDNLSGNADSLRVEYANTDGSNSVYGSYTLPVTPQNATIALSAQYNSTNIIQSPFDRLDITGYSLYYDITFRAPIIQTPGQELALGITAGREENKTNILGRGFPLSTGANRQGETALTVLRFFQDWTRRQSNDVLALRSQFSFGIDALNATINSEPPDGRFFDWLGQLQYVRLLAADTLLVVRSSLQLSADPLVPIEQFPIGGLYSVRGYRQDLLLTDNGVFASVEARLPILRINEVKGLLQIVPFLDFGVGWNNGANPIPTPGQNTLMSAGLGLQYGMGGNFNARLDWGIPLIQIRLPGNISSEQSIYFSVNYKFF